MATVMIVDDAAFMRMTLKNMLTKNEYEVVAEVENGEKAIEMYKTHRPDVITMDITMPDMDGIEAVKKIMEINPEAKIVMCSAMGQQTMVLNAIKFGAKDFVIKPFDEERVIAALEKVLD